MYVIYHNFLSPEDQIFIQIGVQIDEILFLGWISWKELDIIAIPNLSIISATSPDKSTKVVIEGTTPETDTIPLNYGRTLINITVTSPDATTTTTYTITVDRARLILPFNTLNAQCCQVLSLPDLGSTCEQICNKLNLAWFAFEPSSNVALQKKKVPIQGPPGMSSYRPRKKSRHQTVSGLALYGGTWILINLYWPVCPILTIMGASRRRLLSCSQIVGGGCGADWDNRDVEGGESNYYEQLVASVYIIFILVITI